MCASGSPLFPRVLSWLAVLVIGVCPLFGQVVQENNADPSELFLKAFTAVQQGEKLETDGRLKPALAKYRFAASVLEQIGQNNPNWQPLIVRYRLRKTADNIHELEQKIYLQPPAGASGPEQPSVAVTGATANGEEDSDLPKADDPLPGLGANHSRASAPAPTPSAEPAVAPEVTAPAFSTGAAPAAAAPPRDDIDKATQDIRSRLDKSQKDLKAALDQLNAAQKDKQQALKDKKNVEFELETLHTGMKTAQKKVDKARAGREEAENDLDAAEKRLKDLAAKNPSGSEESRKELKDQVGKLKARLAKASADSQAAAHEKDTLSARLTESEGRNAALTKERDALAANGSPADAAKTIADLQAKNSELSEKLTAAETKISELGAESEKKNNEVEGMQKELASLKEQLSASRDQNDRNATTITELKTQLDASAESLKTLQSSGQSTEDFARMNKENELLRGIVMRQLKDQARRVAAKKLISDELNRLEVQSKTLTDQIAVLGQPSQPLSDDERALFKEPQITISDTSDPSELATSIGAIRPKSPDAAAAPSASPDSGLPSPAPESAAAASPGAAAGADANAGPSVETSQTPQVAEALMPMAREAKEAFERGKYADAEKEYEKLLARDPKNAYLLSSQGVVLFRQEKLKSAEIMLKKAVAIAPKDAFSQATLGIIYYKMHRYDDAIANLTAALRIDPKNATAHNYLGITSSQKGWPEAALDEEQKAIALNPNYADAHFNIAVMYITGQPPAKDQALEHYRRATQLGATPDPNLEKLIGN